MTPTEYRAALQTLGITSRGLARMCGIPESTALTWTSARKAPIPEAVADWLRGEVAHRIAHPAPRA